MSCRRVSPAQASSKRYVRKPLKGAPRAQLTGLKDLIDAVPTITGAVLDGVTTGNPGDPATVNLSVVGTELHFSFTLPRGDTGPPGNDGQTGLQGPPGEVTNASLAAAIDGTSSNSNTVNTLLLGAPAAYDQLQQQDLITKVNELILALRR
jgi:hypothetical protein